MKSVSPILWTKDIDETVRFYQDTLGFSPRSNFPDFVSLSNGNVEIMFIKPRSPAENCLPEGQDFFPQPLLTGSLFILMSDVDDFWNVIKDKVNVKTSLADREYLMRDFSILDNNGYELVFGQDISC